VDLHPFRPRETPELEEVKGIRDSKGNQDAERTSYFGKTGGSSNRTRGLALVAVLAALYVAANAVPIDAFIGGSGFITAGIILLPVMARLVRPREAVVLAVLAPLGLLAFQLSIIPVFGFFGLAIPALAILLGSLGSHRSHLIPAAYVIFGGVWYLLFSGGTLLWLAPYAVAVALSVGYEVKLLGRGGRWGTVVHTFDTTMCELVTMNILSVSLIHLPGGLWVIILPFMILERSVAVIGGSSVLLVLTRVKGPLKLEGL
jgi:hypothetical protein